jgi:transcription initiation factor TFIIIB Brf1 subunit/transcription initiation factor TFIIB
MATPLRSIRPKCPECGFSVFNRRFAKCESCGVVLPTSIVYTADELKLLAEKDKADEEARQKALARQKAGNKGKKDNNGDWLGDVDGIDFDFSD